jgi:glycosyltransferase involved in cell wall biosynthesis
VKLGLICPEYPPFAHGGVGTFTQDLGRALVRAGHEVRVAGVYPMIHGEREYEEDAGVRVWRIPTPKGRFGWMRARHQLYRLVREWVRERSVELVESPDCYGWFAGWPALAVPLVLRAHGSLRFYAHELGQTVPATTSRLEAWSHRRADAWAAVSHHAGDLTQKIFSLPSGPDAVIYNPVTIPSHVVPFESRRPSRVVYSGTLTAKKGVVSLFRAWARVREQCPAAELHMFGKDQTRPDGTTMSEFLKGLLPERERASVRFHGHVLREQLMEALQGARAAVFPSYTETFGLGPVEAMACAVPTIYTKRSCGPEIVRDGVDGILVEPDEPAEISGAILGILGNETLARRLSEAGRQRAFFLSNPDSILAANLRFYDEQCRSFRGRDEVVAA